MRCFICRHLQICLRNSSSNSRAACRICFSVSDIERSGYSLSMTTKVASNNFKLRFSTAFERQEKISLYRFSKNRQKEESGKKCLF